MYAVVIRGLFIVFMLVLKHKMVDYLLMAYNLPPPESQPEREPNEQFVDITASPDWQEFCDTVIMVEEALNETQRVSEDELEETIDNFTEQLSVQFGENRQNCKSELLAEVAIIDVSGNHTGQTKLVYTDEQVSFNQVTISYVDESWRVRLEFTSPESTDDLENCYYHVNPDKYHLMHLAIQENEDVELTEDDIHVNLAANISSARRLTRSDDFLTADTQEQIQLLDSITTNMHNDFIPFCQNQDVSITCTKFFSVFDDMSELSISLYDSYTDQTRTPEDEQFIIEGQTETFIYPELIEQPDRHFKAMNDFTISQGVPCLTVYNKQKACRYYIISDSIQTVGLTFDEEHEE